ncbi:MAG: RNA 2',3'-cyclic phosphodiesterase [Solirubrobacterales bacterium]|nr:RNA 2',3'-cyclic phosphodiesterase [Solirubrobacterales bacterium]
MATERLKSPRARLFVALCLPEHVRDEITAWQASFTDAALRPVMAESLHLTLCFLGYRAEEEIPRIAEAALDVSAAAPEVSLGREVIGLPKRKSRPGVFVLEAHSEGLVALQAAVEGSLVRAGFHEAEGRPFWPHLTVARVRREKSAGRKPAAVVEPPGPPPEHTFFFRPFPCVRLVLLRSRLRRSGAEYESMAELELPTAETREKR